MDNSSNQSLQNIPTEQRIHQLNQIDKDLIHLLEGIDNQTITKLASIIKDIKAEIISEKNQK